LVILILKRIKKLNLNGIIKLIIFLYLFFNKIIKDCKSFFMGSGIGLNFRLIKISSEFKMLNRKNIMDDYEKAKKRLILLDYEVISSKIVYMKFIFLIFCLILLFL